MTEVVKAGQTGLAIREDQSNFTQEQAAALRHIGVEDASDGDLQVFFHQVKRTGLDPFARQIYMIGRRQKDGDKWVTKQTIQTGIDGFRLIAHRTAGRTGETLGYEDTLFCDQNGNWHEVVPRGVTPLAAKVTVLRNGQRFPAVAQYDEYVGTTRNGDPTQMWRTKPGVMLSKCAEALALRKAFPQDLSGLYTSEEMQQADTQEPAPQQRRQQSRNPQPASPGVEGKIADVESPAEAVEYIDDEQWAAIRDHLEAQGVTDEAGKGKWVMEYLDRSIGGWQQVTRDEAVRMLADLAGQEETS